VLVSGVSESVVSGLYGHNSNTDAEAELIAFRACMNGEDGRAQACAACGAGGQGRQDPCEAMTNTARSFWDKTASSVVGVIPHDLVPAISDPKAGTSPSSPTCGWSEFPVEGM
jgi:hypothetical protein